MNVTDPIRRIARLRPDLVAMIRAGGAAVTYSDLDRMIDATAARLTALGLKPGQTVGQSGLALEGLRFIALAMAMARLGITSAAPGLPDAWLDACFVPEGGAAPPGVRAVSPDDAWTPDILDGDPAISPAPMCQDPSAICRIFASSGTTGVPKFAAISHDLLFRRVSSNVLSMGPPPSIHLCAVGVGITFGFTSILRTFWYGRTLVLANPADAVEAIRHYHVSSMVIAPMTLEDLLATIPDGDGPLPSLRMIEVGGSLLPARMAALARQKLCDNVVIYFGSVETGGVASAPISLLGGDYRLGGMVHAGVEVEAVGSDDKPLPHGGEGILRMRSELNIAGYFRDTDRSGGAFRDGWFYSGDLGSVSEDGLLRLTGRTGDVINVGGLKLNPHAIEDVLLALPDVTDAAAFGVPDAMGMTQIWAAIVAPVKVDASVLNAACAEKLRDRSPRFIMQLRSLPRNSNGKLRREELVKLAMSRDPAGPNAAHG